MPLGIDFGKLDLRSALDFAIGIEEDTQLRYQEYGRAVAEESARALLLGLVESEARHRRQLEARRHVLFRHATPRFDTSLHDEEDDDGPYLTAREALELALGAEREEHGFYAAAIPHVKDADVRAFFEQLRHEEAEQEAVLREKLSELAADGGP